MENRIIQFQCYATVRHIPVVLTYDVSKQAVRVKLFPPRLTAKFPFSFAAWCSFHPDYLRSSNRNLNMLKDNQWKTINIYDVRRLNELSS